MVFEPSLIWFALILTALAGLSTGLGGIVVLKTKITNVKFLATALGFSAGVMIYVAFVELFAQGRVHLVAHFGAGRGAAIAVLGFFAGIALIAIIDALIPEESNPHEPQSVETIDNVQTSAPQTESPAEVHKGLARTGLFTAIVIGIHNFPEGMATFVSTLSDPSLGISIAIAIAIHNIPEGVSVAVPVYYATGDRRKALIYAFLSGLAEPVGALMAAAVLMPFLNAAVLGFIFSLVAGIMVFISLDELLPSAERYGEHHFAIYGVVGGMAVMASGLLLF